MKALIGLLLSLALILAGVGFYRGWFTVTNPSAPHGNKVNVNLEMDRGRIQDDAKLLKRKANELTENVSGTDKTPDK